MPMRTSVLVPDEVLAVVVDIMWWGEDVQLCL